MFTNLFSFGACSTGRDSFPFKNSGKNRCRGCPTTCKTLPSDFGYINAKDLHEHSVSNPYPKYKATHTQKKKKRQNTRVLPYVHRPRGRCQPAKPPPPYCRHPGALRGGAEGACPSVHWRFSFLIVPFRAPCRSQPRREARTPPPASGLSLAPAPRTQVARLY